MIPTLIFVGLVVGLATARPLILLSAILLLGLAWAGVVAGLNGAEFLGGLAIGAANAAAGVIVGTGIRILAEAISNAITPRGRAR